MDELLSIVKPEGERLATLEAQMTTVLANQKSQGDDIKSLIAANNQMNGVRSLIFMTGAAAGAVASVWNILQSAFSPHH